MPVEQLPDLNPDAVTVAALKQHMRIEPDFVDEDSLIGIYIAAAERMVLHATGTAASRHQFRFTTPKVSSHSRLSVPVAPLVSVDTVEADGTPLDPTQYKVTGLETDCPVFEPLVSGELVVTVTAGFQTAPPDLQHAVTLLAAHLFEQREPTTSSSGDLNTVPWTVEQLLFPYKRGVV